MKIIAVTFSKGGSESKHGRKATGNQAESRTKAVDPLFTLRALTTNIKHFVNEV